MNNLARIEVVRRIARLDPLKWAGLSLFVVAGLEVGRALLAAFTPIVLDYSEMIVAGATEQLRVTGSLHDIYAPPAAPYGMPGVQYPPLFILLNVALRGLSGLGSVLSERLLTWSLYLASGGLVGVIVWQETGKRRVALLTAALPFCFWNVIIFLHAGRVDPLALFFSLLAAYVYRRQSRLGPPTFRGLLLVAGLCVLAFLSKQTYLAAPAAIFLDLLLLKKPNLTERWAGQLAEQHPAPNPYMYAGTDLWAQQADAPTNVPTPTNVPGLPKSGTTGLTAAKNINPQPNPTTILRASIYPQGNPLGRNLQSTIYNPLVFALAWLALTALALTVLGWWSGGELFGIYDPARAGSFILSRVPGFVSIFLLDHLPLLVIALVGLWRLARQGDRFWPLYTLFAALACTTIVKDGAVDYYFNELAYVLSVGVGLGLATALKTGRRRLVTAGLAVQTLIALGMLVGWSHWRDFDMSRQAYQQGLALVRSAQTSEAQGGKPALVLVDSFLLETGQPQKVADYFIYSVLLSNRRRDPTPLINDLQNERYGMIITENFLRWPPLVEAALANRYNLRIILGEDGRKPYWVYTLRSAPTANP